MSQDIIKQLKSLRRGAATPRSEWVVDTRAQLMRQIKNTVSEKASPVLLENLWASLSVLLPERMVFDFVRPVAILLIVAMVGTSGWVATVDASYESIPGDWLYPAKRITERTQVAAAVMLGDKKSETKLHTEFAKRRASEAKKVIASTNPATRARALEAVSDLKKEINSVNTQLDNIKDASASKDVAEIVKNVQQNSTEIKDVLKEVKTSLQTGTTTTEVDKTLNREITDVKDLVKDTQVKAVEVMVEKHVGGDIAVTKEDVRDSIQTTLQSVTSETTESKQNVDNIKTIVDTVKTEVKDFSEDQKKQQSAPTTTTVQLAAQIATAASDAKAAAIKTEAATTEVGKRVTEAEKFVVSGDLTKAIGKIKEATEAAKEVDKIKDDTIEKVQTVLPIVPVIKDIGITTSTPVIVAVVTTTPSVPSTSISTTLPVVVPPPTITVTVSGTKK